MDGVPGFVGIALVSGNPGFQDCRVVGPGSSKRSASATRRLTGIGTGFRAREPEPSRSRNVGNRSGFARSVSAFRGDTRMYSRTIPMGGGGVDPNGGFSLLLGWDRTVRLFPGS